MYRILLCSFSFFLANLVMGQQFTKDSLAVVSVLMAQEKAWNNYDIDTFMEGYWKSPDLVFCGASGPVFGWEATRKRYKKTYNSPEKMGQLQFKILHLQAFKPNVIQLIGRFELERKPVPASGFFTLLWHRTPTGWKIVSDHTSSESP